MIEEEAYLVERKVLPCQRPCGAGWRSTTACAIVLRLHKRREWLRGSNKASRICEGTFVV